MQAQAACCAASPSFASARTAKAPLIQPLLLSSLDSLAACLWASSATVGHTSISGSNLELLDRRLDASARPPMQWSELLKLLARCAAQQLVPSPDLSSAGGRNRSVLNHAGRMQRQQWEAWWG